MFNQDLLTVGHYYGSRSGRASLRAALDEARLSCVTSAQVVVVQQYTGTVVAGGDHICTSAGLISRSDSVQVWPNPSQRGSALSDHFGVCINVAA